jgi:hypothetical protein
LIDAFEMVNVNYICTLKPELGEYKC